MLDYACEVYSVHSIMKFWSTFRLSRACHWK